VANPRRGALAWRTAYWRRVAPGAPGGAAVLFLPLLFFLPLESVPIFGERFRGVAILIWLLSVSLALGIRGPGGLRHETAIWTYQKGISLGEVARRDWLLDLGLLALVSSWWATVGVAAVRPSGAILPGLWAAFFSLGFGTGALTHTVTLFLSSVGIRRSTDLTILLAVLSLSFPVLSLRTPEWVRALTEVLLPPFRTAVELHGAIRTGEVEGMIGALLHLLVFSSLFLGIGLWRLSVWRPRG
jgi:hypothetical protein